MSDTVKLIIDIPEEYRALFDTERCKSKFDSLATNEFGYVLRKAFENGTPLDSNSERAEVQAYFDGQAYGWEEGRKALIDDVKAEIEQNAYPIIHGVNNHEKGMTLYGILQVLDNIGKAESEDTVRNARKVTKKDSHKEWWDSFYKGEIKPNE